MSEIFSCCLFLQIQMEDTLLDEGKLTANRDEFEQILKHVKAIVSSSISNSNDSLLNQNYVQESNQQLEDNTNVKLKDLTGTDTDKTNRHLECNGDVRTSDNFINGVDFGIKELLIITNEYDKLKENYLLLQNEVESIFANKSAENNNDLKKSKEEINSLQEENQK